MSRPLGAGMRWWVYRGWAFTAALLLAVPAVALQPPEPVKATGLPSQLAFAVAAVLYLLVGCIPEQHQVRFLATLAGTFATSLRALTLVLADSGWKCQAVGITAWMLAMLYCASTPVLTYRYTRHETARRCSLDC